ncbi:MAG TPA: cytochrome b/b6 domain-containing protein, partial [Candidatus Krumholzibacteria bacterium]|nr:cytochrome b/b6 domain-containing protein [Candidatus Krumholzibacteria bacterium]
WVLLIGVLGGMLLHNAIILFFYIRKNWRKQKGEENRRRFNRSEIWQHSLFLISFVLLALSGFMLAYPDHWWARTMTALGVDETARRLIHRVSAVVMVAVSLYHLYWIAFTSYGRGELKRIAPRLRDARELLQNMRFHMGKSEQQAAFAKFDYPAKMEYWALVWGTVVMALTGAILWFPVVATSIFPSWIVDVATVIHLFEAWLATLAILIFHFFFVIFHPEVYPLSFAMLRGTMPSRLAEHHHPAWRKEDDAPAPAEE